MKVRLRVFGLAMLAVLATSFAEAEAPKTSIRPMPRAIVETPVPALTASTPIASEAPVSVLAGFRPRSRPSGLAATLASAPAKVSPTDVAAPDAIAPDVAEQEPARKGLLALLRPVKRPDVPPKATSKKQAPASTKGSVCGDPEIKGEKLAPVKSKVKGCGIPDAVRVTSVAGVRLSTPATVNCSAAKALKTWVKKGVGPVYGKGKVVQLEIFASYSCRPRNNQKGAKVSEHGRGNAIDIGGLTFSNGKSVSVLKNYDKSMRKIHKNACGPFGTTLGPGSDGYHENHLHFDTISYRGGRYCR